MKRIALLAATLGLALACATSGSASSTRAANYAVPSFACGQPVTVSITNFPNNGKQNEVNVGIKVNGVAQTPAPVLVTFVGATDTYKSSVITVAGSTYEVTSTWNYNGVSGNDDSGAQSPTGCVTPPPTPAPAPTPAPPVTTTVTVTTPAPVAPVVPPVTTTVTTTVTTPAPVAPVTVSTPPKPRVVYIRVKVKSKPKTIVVTKKVTVVKVIRVRSLARPPIGTKPPGFTG